MWCIKVSDKSFPGYKDKILVNMKNNIIDHEIAIIKGIQASGFASPPDPFTMKEPSEPLDGSLNIL